uniref:ShKT domain-containing protein n=1 Tax=Parascaris univalens TaxID=6257 RepID=A0A915AK97_PARUN
MGSTMALIIFVLNLFVAEVISQIIFGTYWFNDDQKRRIIQIHNQLRASEPASNMQEMVWDDRLASLALGHVQRCDAWHRSAYERRGYGYSYIGENIWWSNEAYLRTNLESVILDFYNEKPFYDFQTTGCWGAQCGHYTQVVWASTCAVGCAAVHCDGIRNGHGIYRGHIIVCNYGEGGNMYGQRPFFVGPRCSQCPGGGGCTSEGLCAPMCYGVRFPRFIFAQPRPLPYTRSFPYQNRISVGNRFQRQAAIGNTIQQQTTFGNRIQQQISLGNRMQRQISFGNGIQQQTTFDNKLEQRSKLGAQQKEKIKQFYSYKCMDLDDNCEVWAQNGGCDSNRNFMVRRCPRTCNACQESTSIVNQASGCMDSYRECATWAQRNRCRGGNARFMEHFCRRSCRLCGDRKT